MAGAIRSSSLPWREVRKMSEKYVRCGRCLKLIGMKQVKTGRCKCGAARMYGTGRISLWEKIKIWLGLLK